MNNISETCLNLIFGKVVFFHYLHGRFQDSFFFFFNEIDFIAFCIRMLYRVVYGNKNNNILWKFHINLFL